VAGESRSNHVGSWLPAGFWWKTQTAVCYPDQVFGPEDEMPLYQTDSDAGGSHTGSCATYDCGGTDRSLIRSNLKRTPTECLQALEEMMQLIESARRVDESVR
jgi:hypothetical protein